MNREDIHRKSNGHHHSKFHVYIHLRCIVVVVVVVINVTECHISISGYLKVKSRIFRIQVALRIYTSLMSSFPDQLHRRSIILGHTIAVPVNHS